MAVPGSFIKLDRGIMSWRWYANANTFRVFVHLLLTANFAQSDFETVTVGRGEAVTSYERLSHELHLSIQQVRTAVSHLKATGELTVRRYSKFQVIRIVNYDIYQGRSARISTDTRQADGSLSAGRQQYNKNIINKEGKNNNLIYEAPEKRQFGRFGNVYLGEAELEELESEYPGKVETAIEFLDSYIEEDSARKEKYLGKNHALVMRRWVFSAVGGRKPSKVRSVSGGERLDFNFDDICEKPDDLSKS